MRPLGARWLGLALALLTSGAVRHAWAQDAEVEGFFAASVGFTDNIDSRPPGIPGTPAIPPSPGNPDGTPATPGVEGPQADGFTALSPGIAFVYTTPRVVYRASYTFNTTLYFQNPEGNTVGNAVGLAARFETSEITSLLLSLGAEQGQLNQVTVGETASTRPVQFVSPGDNVYFRFTAGEGLEIQASENVSVLQTLGASLYVPLDGQRVQTYDGTLGVVRTFNYDSLGLTAGVGYANFEEFEEPVNGVVTAQTQQITTRLTGTWIHSYTDYLTHQLDAGVVMVMRANDGGGRLVQPVGRAAVRYVRPEAAASIEYAHDATPNVFIGTNVLTDSVVARLLVPIVGTELATEGSGGYSMARQIDLNGDLGDPAHLWTGDVALLWAPAGVRGNLQMALRYQVVNQSSADTVNPGPGVSPTQDFTRNTVLLSVTAAYPDIERGTAPASSAPPFRTVPASGGFLEAPDPGAPVGPGSPGSPGSPTSPGSPGTPGAAPADD